MFGIVSQVVIISVILKPNEITLAYRNYGDYSEPFVVWRSTKSELSSFTWRERCKSLAQ